MPKTLGKNNMHIVSERNDKKGYFSAVQRYGAVHSLHNAWWCKKIQHMLSILTNCPDARTEQTSKDHSEIWIGENIWCGNIEDRKPVSNEGTMSRQYIIYVLSLFFFLKCYRENANFHVERISVMLMNVSTQFGGNCSKTV